MGNVAAIINGEWFIRSLIDAERYGLHITSHGDSLEVSGSNTTNYAYYTARAKTWHPPGGWAGWQLPSLNGTAYATGWVTTVQTPSSSSYANAFPGMTTPEGNTDGRTVGGMNLWPFTANVAADTLMRRSSINDDRYFASSPEWVQRALKARVYALKTPTGTTEIRLFGQRAAVSGTGTNTDLSVSSTGGVDETLIKIEANIAAGSGSAGLLIATGSADETTKDAVLGGGMIYDATNPYGVVWDTISMGGWGIQCYSSTSGKAVSDGGSYTAKFANATLEQYYGQSAISGRRRIIVLACGQNDSALTEAQFLTELQAAVTRIRARFDAISAAQPDFILMSPPDPGPTYDARYDGFDRSVKTTAESMTTAASRIAAIQSRPLLGGSTLVGRFGTSAIVDTVHPSEAGGIAFESERWAAITELSRRIGSRRRGRSTRLAR